MMQRMRTLTASDKVLNSVAVVLVAPGPPLCNTEGTIKGGFRESSRAQDD